MQKKEETCSVYMVGNRGLFVLTVLRPLINRKIVVRRRILLGRAIPILVMILSIIFLFFYSEPVNLSKYAIRSLVALILILHFLLLIIGFFSLINDFLKRDYSFTKALITYILISLVSYAVV